MELKIQCNCGQKYKFDVEPVNRLMPYAINCPVCGIDGTSLANSTLAQTLPAPPQMPPPLPSASPTAPPPVTRLATSLSTQAAAAKSTAAPVTAIRPVAIAPPAKVPGQFNLGLGIAGALAGALVGSGLLYAISEWAGFKFPFFGVATGFLTAYGARLLGKGGNQTLGIICAVVAAGSVFGTLYLLFGGEFPPLNIISVVLSASVAYRVAAR